MNKRNANKGNALKAVVALLLAFALVLPMATPVFAAEGLPAGEDPDWDVTVQELTAAEFNNSENDISTVAVGKSSDNVPRPVLYLKKYTGLTLRELTEKGKLPKLPKGWKWAYPETVVLASEGSKFEAEGREYEVIFDPAAYGKEFIGNQIKNAKVRIIVDQKPMEADVKKVFMIEGETYADVEAKLPENWKLKEDLTTKIWFDHNAYKNGEPIVKLDVKVYATDANYKDAEFTEKVWVYSKPKMSTITGYIKMGAPIYAAEEGRPGHTREAIGLVNARDYIVGKHYKINFDDFDTSWVDSLYVYFDYNGTPAMVEKKYLVEENLYIKGQMALRDYIYKAEFVRDFSRPNPNFVANLTPAKGTYIAEIEKGAPVEGFVVTIEGVDYIEMKLADGSVGYVLARLVVENLDQDIQTRTQSGWLTDNVYIREMDGDKYSVLGKGTKVDGIVDGNWLIITIEGRPYKIAREFISDKKVDPTPVVTPEEKYEKASGYTKSSVYVRPAKGSSDVLDILPAGAAVNGIVDGDWIRFTHNGKTAYVAKWVLAADKPVLTINGFAKNSVYIRPEKNSSASLGILPAGAEVEGIVEGAWTQIKYNGKTAYIATAFIGDKPTVEGVTTSAIYVRPEKNSTESVGILSKGSEVIGVQEGAWVKIQYKGAAAYVAKAFVK